MRLIGVRFTSRSDGPEKTVSEFRLDSNDPNRVVMVLGQDLSIADYLEEGVESDPPYVNELGEKYGVQMPSEPHRFTAKDGIKFLIALMSRLKGNAYGGTYPIEDSTGIRAVDLNEIIWIETVDLDKGLGHGVELWSRFVPQCQVAFIDGYDWYHKTGSPATVKILKLHTSFPLRIVRPSMRSSDIRTEFDIHGARSEDLESLPLAQNHPKEWYIILAEIHAAVYFLLKEQPSEGLVTPHVMCHWNC